MKKHRGEKQNTHFKAFSWTFLVLAMVLYLSFSPSLVSGQTYQVGTDVLVSVPFEVNGSRASPTADCNVSVFYPNGSYLKNNSEMTNQGTGVFTLTLNENNITQIGEYEWTAFCCDNGNCATGFDMFEITPSGFNLTTGQGIVYSIFLIAMLFTFIFCFIGAIKLPWKDNMNDDGMIIGVNDLKYVKVFLYVISYLLLMFFFAIMRSITLNFLSLDNVSIVFNWLFWIMFSFLWPLIVVSLILTVVSFLNGKKLMKALERGVPMR